MKYLLIDTANMFFRARHTAYRAVDAEEKVGWALHVTMSSVNKVVQQFGADHVIFALEGRSWRKDVYEPYKKNRSVARAALSDAELEEDKMFWETLDDLVDYLRTQTNCSVIRQPEAEADDIIARWIDLHPEDKHVIVSSDTDFVQLLNDRVTQYNGIADQLITTEGIFDGKGKPVIDKKTKAPKETPDPGWLLFEKCMRGDSSDNIFSAYPGVRKKGTKNKVGLLEAYADREKRGYAWNNLMLSRWTDHNGEEHRVLDDYERNRALIDLQAQPQNIKDAVDVSIVQELEQKEVPQVGVRFMKFCGKHNLAKLSESAEQYAKWLTAKYQGDLLNVKS